jgi:alpha-methylacyl-CoA racemase
MAGPLQGVKIIELAGLGPAPFACMLLADLGADVIVIDRPASSSGHAANFTRGAVYLRGRRSVAVDLKHPEGPETVARLTDQADVFIEGMRPGVAERLGVGPDVLRARNPQLVYGRMTGWGQDGPLAARAGHDINYLGLAGPLAHIGRAGAPPTPPLNLVADFGGGGMLLALGVLAALTERNTSGEGQVVDAAMIDGVGLLSAPLASAYALGFFSAERGTNLLDSGAPFYDVYETADAQWLSVGAIEPQFYAELLRVLGLDGPDHGDLPTQHDQARWPELKAVIAGVIATRTRAEWEQAFDGVDACVAPVLGFAEVATHPHHVEREGWVSPGGVLQPAPAPRFDRTPAGLGLPPAQAGEHTEPVLSDFGFTAHDIDHLRTTGAIA